MTRTGIVLTVVCLLFAALAAASAFTLKPWCDEAWFSSPALNLITHGYMGTSILDPTATWRSVKLDGIDRHTYWIMPLYVLAQAAWYKLAGFGLVHMRALSIVWGVLALYAWFTFVRAVCGSRRIALIAVALTAIDFQFVWSGSVGRMDMMAAALEFSALAVYVRLRETRLAAAVLASHALMAAAVLTHPIAVVAGASLVLVTIWYDARLLRPRHALLAALPYATGALAWGLYIAQAPGVFWTQFSSNGSDRWALFTSPVQSLSHEVIERYLYTYGFAPETSTGGHIKIIVLLVYALGIAAGAAVPKIRTRRGHTIFAAMAVVHAAGILALDGLKQQFYLVHVIPLFAVLLAFYLDWLASGARLQKLQMAAIVIVLAAVQLAVTGARIAQNGREASFGRAAAAAKQRATPGALVMASAEFAFVLGFDSNLVDDFRLGFRTGRRPDVIVMDHRRYDEWYQQLESTDPANYGYIRDLLADYRLVYDSSDYKVYDRPR